MDDPLLEVKRRLSTRHLGRQGVHGFGLHRSEREVVVYLSPGGPGDDQESLVRELEREAAPFRLVVVYEPPPRIT